jgi:tetratricopeptide (TPR) repeat protein
MSAVAPQLDACPLCRTTLRGGEERCPGCGADLLPYLENAGRAQQLLALAREQLSRGDTASAVALLPQISRIAAVDAGELTELEARIALAQQDFATVRTLAEKLGGSPGQSLLAELEARRGQQRQARELYNQALTEARQGSYAAAAQRLQHAVGLAPAEPALWQLKLKCDLKARLLYRSYDDLQALDRLRARPLAFARLEALLPPSLPA